MGSADTDRMYMCIDLKSFYASVECADLGLEILDIVSIRGYGRLQIQKIEGRTKKDKIKVELGLLEKNKK